VFHKKGKLAITNRQVGNNEINGFKLHADRARKARKLSRNGKLAPKVMEEVDILDQEAKSPLHQQALWTVLVPAKDCSVDYFFLSQL